MSTIAQTNAQPSHGAYRLLSTPNGTRFEILASPDEVGDGICLIRGTVPPAVAVPLHSHSDVELFYVLEGSMEVFLATQDTGGWTTVGVGSVVSVPANVKHALRNTSSVPATLIVVTTSKLYEFFREVSKPFDPNHQPGPQTPEEIKIFLGIVARYGYWVASLEDNAAIGIRL